MNPIDSIKRKSRRHPFEPTPLRVPAPAPRVAPGDQPKRRDDDGPAGSHVVVIDIS